MGTPQWTNKLPTQEGYYWYYKPSTNLEPCIIFIYMNLANNKFYIKYMTEDYELSYFNKRIKLDKDDQWLGPLKPILNKNLP